MSLLYKIIGKPYDLSDVANKLKKEGTKEGIIFIETKSALGISTYKAYLPFKDKNRFCIAEREASLLKPKEISASRIYIEQTAHETARFLRGQGLIMKVIEAS